MKEELREAARREQDHPVLPCCSAARLPKSSYRGFCMGESRLYYSSAFGSANWREFLIGA